MSTHRGLVVFEGLDMSGKTTLINGLESCLDFVQEKGSGSNTVIGRFARSQNNFGLFLLESVIQTAYARKKAKNNLVFMDRSYWSPLVYGARVEWDRFIPEYFRPDVLVYVSCGLEERLRRLELKPSAFHEIMRAQPEIIKEREQAYAQLKKKYTGPILEIDTSSESLEATKQRVLAFFRRNHLY